MKDLELVRQVADSGSLTAAARLLHISQSAASQRLSKLQARLDIALVERRDGLMQLTAAGQRLFDASKLIAAEIGGAMADINRMSRQKDDELRIATQCFTCYRWLPFVIRAMREDFPLLRVDVVPEATDTPYDALRKNAIDIAIVSDPNPASGFIAEELFTDELFAIMHSSHELSSARYLDASRFEGQTLILYTGSSHAIVDEVLAPAGVENYEVIQVRITEAIIELARSGQGIAVIAGWALDDLHDADGLVAVRITKGGFKRTWRAVVGPAHNEKYLRSFLDCVRKVGSTIQKRAWRQKLRQRLPQ